MKYCKDCGCLNENPLLKYCKKHIWGHQKPKKSYEIKRTPLKQSQKPVKAISEKRKERLASGDREDILFDNVRQYKKNCWVCNILITGDETFTFPHILAKGMYKALRLLPQNIGRACSIDHHDILDKLIAYNSKNGIQSKKEIELTILSGKEVVINKENLKLFYKKV